MPLISSNTSLFEIRDFQTWLGKVVLNRYFYICVQPILTPSAVEVAQAFDGLIVAGLVANQAETVTHDLIEVIQLNAADNFATRNPTNDQGLLVGQPLPAFNALNVKLIRQTRETRNGSKRFAGLREADVLDGIVETGSQGAWTTFANLLTDELTTVTGDDPVPCIIGNIYDTSVEPKELLPVQAWTYNLITAAVPDFEVSSQVSRK